MSESRLSLQDASQLATDILVKANTSVVNARSVTDALVAAERDGQYGHGLSRLPSYAAQSASGKVAGHAVPKVTLSEKGCIRIDAGNGFAFPALDMARQQLTSGATECGICAASIYRSHHFGQAGYQVEQLADQGLVALAFGNSPKAIAPWGGADALFGTNPIAFAAPRLSKPSLVIDLSLSKVARGKIMVAAENNTAIPEAWAFDAEGHPTSDPERALAGTMAPMGDAKGAALVMMVEVLAAALTGANFGSEASSFFSPDGPPPGVGQLLIVIDPQAMSAGSFSQRLEFLINQIEAQPGSRLPGSRRLEHRAISDREGLNIKTELLNKLQALV